MDTVLLTGFEPFGGDTRNPSIEVARALEGEVVRGRVVRSVELPCVFGRALPVLDDAIARLRPVLVICLGLAASRTALGVERVAINLDDAPIPDNAGESPRDRPVVDGGPAAYFSTLPVKAIAAAWDEAGLPGEVSLSAGSYLCNHVFYGLQHRGAQARTGTAGAGPAWPSGFIHLPLTAEMAAGRLDVEGMPMDRMEAGVRRAIEVSLDVLDGADPGVDLPGTGGRID